MVSTVVSETTTGVRSFPLIAPMATSHLLNALASVFG